MQYGSKKIPEKKIYEHKQHEKKSISASKFCPAFGRCGGCALLDLPYREQLAKKQEQVNGLLRKFGKVDQIIGMKGEPWHYRNKVHWAFGTDRKGKIIAGTYEESTHRIVPISSCKLENETANRILCTIRDLMPSFHLTAYNENTGRGFLRHVLIRTAHQTGQVMVVLVAATKVFPGKNNFIRVLREKHPEISTIVLNYNDKFTSMVLGEQNTVLWGKGYIEDELCGKRFRISPHSFYQVNSAQTEVLYRTAIELAGLTGKERVIDAYCGVGTIGIVAAEKAGAVLGVELNKDAVRDAIGNAKVNGVKNISFVCGDAGEYMEQLAESEEGADVVLMDPPRTGSSEAFIRSLGAMKPERIVYVSCEPETLARDLNGLTKIGYRVKKMVPVDMFPGTVGCEMVCLLSKKETPR
ncbi:MAG: 23S rRNA (uracil(1939)-C(5))-methyltransferase RlmD [Lachnospiraceae bacterium]|nr:23S rRNA (uracil(1939)-C(5))-methyltransferase RlmD [Lachnospiraceae bacterium]